MRRLRRAAIRAASLTRLARSAPEKPGVPRAIVRTSTSAASGTLRMCTRRIFSRPVDVGVGHHHLAVEAARTQQGRVEHVGAVGGGDQDDALVGLEAVHLHQQLVQRLLALVVAAAQARAAMAADGVDLVDEDDAGGVLLGLLEHVAHAAGADADEHLHEVRAGDGRRRARPPRRRWRGPSRVLPVPGGPTSSAPLGILPPRRWNLAGSFRKSTISASSSLASSTPATSSKVTRFLFSVSSRALDLPKPMAPRAPPCIWRMKKIQTPISSAIGRMLISSEGSRPAPGCSNLNAAPCASSRRCRSLVSSGPVAL